MKENERKYRVRRVESTEDREWVGEVYRSWGAEFVVTRGREVFHQQTEGFYAVDAAEQRVGLVTFEVIEDQLEIITLDAFERFDGVGTALTAAVLEYARSAQIRRVWLITTNDNIEAIRFYQRRGFTIADVHVGEIEHSRKLKPSIPMTGNFGIPLRDEIEFEIWLPA